MSSPATQLRSRTPRLADAALARARLSVVPRSRVRTARAPFMVLVSLLMLAGVVGLLIFNTSMQHASFTLKSLDAKATTLAARQEALAVELEGLRNPQRVAEAARAQGMVMPPAANYLDAETGKVTGDAQPAPASDGERIIALPPRRPAPPATAKRTGGNQDRDTGRRSAE